MNEGEGTDLPFRGILNNWRQYSIIQDMQLNRPTSPPWGTLNDWLPKNRLWKGEGGGVSPQWKNPLPRPGDQGQHQHVERLCPWQDEKGSWLLRVPSSRNVPQPKTSHKLQLGDFLHSIAKLLKSWKTRSQNRGEEGNMRAKCTVLCWRRFYDKKGALGKNWWKSHQVWVLLESIVPALVP